MKTVVRVIYKLSRMALSPSLALCSALPTTAQTPLENRIAALFATGGKYMEQNCSPTSHPEWAGFPLMRCRYTAMHSRAEVTMLNPSPTQLATWISTACQDISSNNSSACELRLLKEIWRASNAQFPVSGMVVESASVIGGPPNQPLCFPFRNGVTVRAAGVSTRPPIAGVCAPGNAEAAPLIAALRFARVASTNRREYVAANGAHPVGPLTGLDVRWAEAVRREYQAAWTSNRNLLITAKAKAMKASGTLP